MKLPMLLALLFLRPCRSHSIQVRGMANYRGPGEALEMQLEQVKKYRFRLCTRKVRRDTESAAEQTTLHWISKVPLAREP